MTSKEIVDQLIMLADDYRIRCIDKITGSDPNVLGSSAYYLGYSEALQFAAELFGSMEG